MAGKQKPPQPEAVPEAFFDAIAYLLPALNRVAQQCEISVGEWIIMWHLKQAGTSGEGTRPTMLRPVLTDLLDKRGIGEANITRLLNSLEDKQLIRRVSLTQRERDQLFGASGTGGRQAVVLQPAGDQKIQEFKLQVATQFKNWRSEQSVIIQKALTSVSGTGLQLAEWFFRGTAR